MTRIAVLLPGEEPTTKQFALILQVCKSMHSLHLYSWSKDSCAHLSAALKMPVLHIEQMDVVRNDYLGLVVPDAPGHFKIPERHPGLQGFLHSFIKFRKPVCIIGTGCGVLLGSGPDLESDWILRGYSLTGPSDLDLLKADMLGKGIIFILWRDFLSSSSIDRSVLLVV